MKYLIVVPDGAGDRNISELGGKTPLETAKLDYINSLAARGQVGMVKTIPDGIPPGSDAANLSVMGYDPSVYLTGRSPLEAVSMGLDMSPTDVAFRVNLVTLKGEGDFENLTIEDHSSGDITTQEADQLIKAVSEAFGNDEISFHTGVSYRHCMLIKDGSTGQELTPPHDVLGQSVGEHLPKGDDAELLRNLTKKSYELLKEHPVNKKRMAEGKNPANSLWIWGQGKKPNLSSFTEKYGIKGTAISAVDLIKGIALCAGLDSADIEGATGTLHTNFRGKAEGAVEEFKKGKDFVYMHLEGPDECSHQGDMEGKIKCLEDIDQKVVKPIVEYLDSENEDYTVLVVPDHRTPLEIRTHSSEPVPFVIYRSREPQQEDVTKGFYEKSGEEGLYFASGYELADYFFTYK